MHYNTHQTEIEVEGFIYIARIKYIGHGDEIEIHDVQLLNEENDWVEMPFLKRVDEQLMREIWDNE